MAASDDDSGRLQQQVDFLEQQLAQAQNLAALGELVSTTTHEFNNVLMTIINYAKMGMRHKDTVTRDKCLEKIFAAGSRAAKITNTVLGMARNCSAGQEPTNLTQLVENTMMLLEREMNKYRIAVDKIFQPVPEAFVNGNQIQQVLLNMLINARQAMRGGGRLIIKLLHDTENEMVDLVIRDNGCGIPAEKLPRIFDRFFTTKSGPDASGKGGTGLGLSMCREIVEAHHGRMQVQSTVGRGTCFTLKLPTAAKAARRAAPKTIPLSTARRPPLAAPISPPGNVPDQPMVPD